MEEDRIQSIIDRYKWRGRMSGGNWAYGSLDMEHYITATIRGIDERTKYPILQIVDTNTLGQYTGLKDKNGTEIYEGDIFTCNGKYPKVIQYRNDKQAFCCANINELKDQDIMDVWQHPNNNWWKEMDIEVVGNIYDNPELLNK